MSLDKIEGKRKEFERTLIPEDVHLAYLYSVVDVGEHESTFAGETKVRHLVRLSFELDDVLLSDGRPMVHTPFGYTVSLSEKSKLRPVVSALLGDEELNKLLDEGLGIGKILEKCLGKAIQLNIVHKITKKGTKVDELKGVLKAPKSLIKDKVGKPVNKIIFVDDVETILSHEGIPKFIIDESERRINKEAKDAF